MKIINYLFKIMRLYYFYYNYFDYNKTYIYKYFL